MKKKVNIIGGGLAGSEAAYQLAKRGVLVNLYEMRPKKKTEVHVTDMFAELVCSNSFRSNSLVNAVGLLKEEMAQLDSLIIKAANKFSLPAGSALAVDRNKFSQYITDTLKSFDNITIINEEVEEILDGYTIIASGPLTSDRLSNSIQNLISSDYLSFYDAIAPIVHIDSVDLNQAYFKSRYDKGDADYLNCAMNQEQFEKFYHELINAKLVETKDFEDEKFFEGCKPIEEIAKAGIKTMLYGPLKPVGLSKDKDHRPYAVVQLRQDNFAKTLYNLVGFQTRLTWPEQKRILRLIPGLENVDIVRYGVMHKNKFINSPKVLNENLQLKKHPNIMVAGQISGVEGYVESSAMGLLAGLNMYLLINDKELLNLDNSTMIGSLSNYITYANSENFQPMNVNYELIKYNFKAKKQVRREMIAKASLEEIGKIKTYV